MFQHLQRTALGALLLCVPACVIEVKEDRDGGNGGGGSSQNAGDSHAHADDDGDRGHGHGHAGEKPAKREKTWYVYGYRERYENIPDLGETKKYLRAIPNEQVNLDQGYLNGDMNCNGQGYTKHGKGHGQTVIDGNLEIQGNNWVLRYMTITGRVKIRGNNNDLSQCELLGGAPDVRGTGNKFPGQ